jgi:hypothetical protein
MDIDIDDLTETLRHMELAMRHSIDEIDAGIANSLAVVTKMQQIQLTCTCSACPEQYEARIGEDIVGYLRLRHGYFYVECPDVGGERVFESKTEGDGCFSNAERSDFLVKAIVAIANWSLRR